MSTPHPPDDDEIHTKGVRVTSAVKYAIILTVIQLVITVFAPLRFWLLRNRRRHSKLAVWSDGWFLFGWLVVMGHGWYAVPYAWFEVEKRRVAMTEREVVLMFVTENSGRAFLVFYILGATEIWAFKMAFLFMYADLYHRTSIRKHALWFTFAFVPLGYFAVIVAAFLECRPLSRNWDINRLLTTGHLCSPVFSRRPNLILLVLTIVSDFLLVLLPLYILASLRLSPPEKHGIAFVFLIAFVSVVAAVGKYAMQDAQGVYSVNEGGETSFEKYHWAVALWFVEIAAAEVAFVLPALKKVVLDRVRREEEKEVVVVQVGEVGEGELEEMLVDRADADAAVWRFLVRPKIW